MRMWVCDFGMLKVISDAFERVKRDVVFECVKC